MADSNEPKKETVRITVTPKPESTASTPSMRETVRIHLPTRPPANPPAEPADSPSPMRAAAAAAMPAPMPPHVSPKKETARITVLPDPPAKPAVQMKKTQPLIDLPKIETPTTTVTVTPQPQPQPPPQISLDQIPMSLCWALLGVSATILILQIWNYLS